MVGNCLERVPGRADVVLGCGLTYSMCNNKQDEAGCTINWPCTCNLIYLIYIHRATSTYKEL